MDVFTSLQTVEGPKSFGFQTLIPENATSHKQLNNKGSSDPTKNTSVQEIPCALRRSSRLAKLKVSRDAKYVEDMPKMPERVFPETLSCEEQINYKSPTKNFRYAIKFYLFHQIHYR